MFLLMLLIPIQKTFSIKVDKALVLAYHNALRDVGSAIGCEDYKLNEQSEILYLSRCPDVINAQEGFFGR